MELLNWLVLFLTAKVMATSTDIAQWIMTHFHMFYTLYYGFRVIDPGLIMHLVSFSMNYYIADSILILANAKKYWYYWLHHAMAIYLAACIKYHYIPLIISARYMFTLELSNLFLGYWTLSRSRMAINLLAATYIPLRTCLLPYYTYQITQSITDNDSYAIIAKAFCTFIQLMSWGFSWKIYRISKLRRRRAQALRLLKPERVH